MDDTVPERLRRVLARVAETNRQEEASANQHLRECETATDDALRSTVSDRSAPSIERRNALITLASRLRRDRTLTDVVLPLFHDPDVDLVRDAIRCAPPFDPRAMDALRALLDASSPAVWSEAAMALSRRKDPKILPRLLDWFRDGDTDHRNAALGCFAYLLGPDDRLDLLETAWDEGGRDEEDRAILACELLSLGDDQGVPFLADLARRAEGHTAIHAADTLYDHDPTLGLELMQGILDRASSELRLGMAERIAKRAEHPHLWTADALSEARSWVERMRRQLDGEVS